MSREIYWAGSPSPLRQAEYVDRTRPLPHLAEAVPYRLGGELTRVLAGRRQIRAGRQERRQRGRVGAAGAVRGAVGVSRAGDRRHLLAGEEVVDDLLAVAAGDDRGPRTQGDHRPGE